MNPAPIILFVYNRPWHTEQVLNALSKNELAKHSVLYIYADGPRVNASDDEIKKIEETRRLIRRKNWCKEIIIRQSETNSGLANSVVNGVSQVIGEHGSVIVLEDDIVVSPYFLKYMNEGLEIYKNEPKVISIHAYNFPINTEGLPETFFIKGADCWGWATWASKWEHLEMNTDKLLKEIEDTGTEYEFDIQGSYPYMQMLRDQRDNKVSSWAICWYASAFLKNKYTLFPKTSIIYNIGFDKTGTHNASIDSYNSAQWNNASPVKVEFHHKIETNQIALSRWKAYHEKTKSFTNAKNLVNFHSIKSLAAKVYRRIFRNATVSTAPAETMWAGNYNNWQEAENQSSGYDENGILEKVKTSTLKVKAGEAAYERDSVAFEKLDYSQELLDILKSIGKENGGVLDIIDFGGSLGSLYFQYRNLLSDIKELKWTIVEQAHFVECGKQFIEDKELKFSFSIDEVGNTTSRVLLLAGVLQYLKEPYKMIDMFLKYDFEYIIIDRTGFIEDSNDRITVQNVPEYIYKASYPVWFLNEKNFLKSFTSQYTVLRKFLSQVSPPLQLVDKTKVYWKGFFLKRK